MNKVKGRVEGLQSFTLNILTSSVKITYNQNQCGPRVFIEQLEEEGFSAELKIKNDDTDIRNIAREEVAKYRWKVMVCAFLYFPLLFCIWCVPYIPGIDDFMVAFNVWNGNTMYVFLCLLFSSIIQCYLGQ